MHMCTQELDMLFKRHSGLGAVLHGASWCAGCYVGPLSGRESAANMASSNFVLNSCARGLVLHGVPLHRQTQCTAHAYRLSPACIDCRQLFSNCVESCSVFCFSRSLRAWRRVATVARRSGYAKRMWGDPRYMCRAATAACRITELAMLAA